MSFMITIGSHPVRFYLFTQQRCYEVCRRSEATRFTSLVLAHYVATHFEIGKYSVITLPSPDHSAPRRSRAAFAFSDSAQPKNKGERARRAGAQLKRGTQKAERGILRNGNQKN